MKSDARGRGRRRERAEAGPGWRVIRTRLGFCGYVAGGAGLLRCTLPLARRADAEHLIRELHPDGTRVADLMPELAAALERFFRGEAVPFTGIRLDLTHLPPFTRRVYRALRRVGFGRTTTYGELAIRAGSPGAARGVGAAIARNPYPPIVPCHRVLGADGGLVGYVAEGGLDLERRLLTSEGGGPAG